MKYYKQKIIRCGDFVEFYNYEVPIGFGPKEKTKKSKTKVKKIVEQKEQMSLRYSSVKRTREKITRLINSNKDFMTFVTLTFKENIIDLVMANDEFNKFVKRLKRKYNSIKYLAVPEFQKRGAVHYHMLLNVEYIENSVLTEIWGNGFVMINKIKHIRNVGLYVSKYIGKDLFDNRYFGMRKILYPRNLDRPKTMRFMPDVSKIVLENNSDSKELYSSSYESKYNGKVDYKLLKIDQNIDNV